MASALLLGTHVSVAGGVHLAPVRAASVGCTAMQVFVKNNRTWDAPPLDPEAVAAWPDALAKANLAPTAVFAHSTYLVNLCSKKPENVEKSLVNLEEELRRCDALGIPGLVMHPGSHGGFGREWGIEAIARNTRTLFLERLGGQCRARLLFETMAGGGGQVGGVFGDLADLLTACDLPENTGVCLDTCHIFAAGYDIRTAEGYAATMEEFGRVVGFANLRAIHLNDSCHAYQSKRDQHAHIGEGHLGREAFRCVMNDPRLRGIPMALETPKDDATMEEDRRNLAVLRELIAEEAAV